MTAEKYVKEVGKLLKCRTSKKKEIKRQLLADINSQVAEGEALTEVLNRMGIPWDYANRYNDNFDKAERKAAKREKTLKIWGIVLLIVVVLAAAAYVKMPKMSDISESTVFQEEQVRAQTEEIITLYSNNDYKAVVEYMDDEMKQVLNASTLQYVKDQMGTDFGELLAFGTMYMTEVRQSGGIYAMVQVNVSYANTSVTYTVTYDESMKLAGFYLK